MQEFTRSLTREIQIDGERLAVTMDKEGLTIRPVGSRRPPATLTWAACVCAAVNGSADTAPEQLSSALAGLKSGRKNTPVPAAAAAAPLLPPAPPATPAGELAGLLGRIDHALAAHRAAFVTALAPGASAQELDEAEKQLGRPLPGDLRTLLAWHNGQNPDGVAAFEQSFSLMNAAQIAARAAALKVNPPPGWQAGFLPFLEDRAESYVVIDLAQLGLPVHEVWRDKPDSPVVAYSLRGWLKRFAEGVEHGAYAEDPERGTFFRKS